jgi:glycosyltransferase involved in cell wall biosynthesis
VLALSLGVPVVVAALPDYEALTGGEEAGWVFRPGDPASLAAALTRAAASGEELGRKAAAAGRRAAALRWPDIADRTAALLDAAVRSRR